jgi:hypothetical protein
MRFKKVDVDRMEGDNPDSLSRTAKVQRRIATALIRPTSASTGEQRQILRDHADYGRIAPDTFSQSITNDQYGAKIRDKKLTKAMSEVELYNSAMPHAEAAVVQARQDNPGDLQRAEWALQNLQEAHYRSNQVVESLKTPPQPSQTSKHVTLAALLGKHAVGYAVSDSNPAMRKEKINDRSKPYIQIEGPEGPTGIHESSDLGEAKATHRANTRTLTRGQRLRARIAPYHAVVHELNDAYGGPEEGGWTYETGENVHTSRGFVTARGAAKEAEKLKTKYTRAKNGRNILSMSPSDVYAMDVDQGVFEPQEYTDNWADAMGVPSRFIQEPNDEDYDYSHFGQHSKDYRVTVGYGGIGNYPKRRPRYE